MRVEYDRFSLKIDGERRLVRSGSLHYFRLPAPDLWRDRLEKMCAAGLNAVDVYYAWSYHSGSPGKFDFSGLRDVDLLHDMIEELGMGLIARPGPYICAELDLGGLPAWLTQIDDAILRCRDQTGFHYSQSFIAAAEEWMREIVPRFASRANLLLVQIENEYTVPQPLGALNGDLADLLMHWLGSDRLMRWLSHKAVRRLISPRTSREARESRLRGQSNPYMERLYRLMRELGVEVPIFHNDIHPRVGRQMDVDLIALDRYPIRDFTRDWRDDPGAFESFRGDEAAHDAHRSTTPVFYPELQGGWYDGWGGVGYPRLRSLLGPESIDLVTKSALAERATLWNYFMFAGGVTWGYMASPDVYTSFDYGAPISESGRIGPRYQAIRQLNEFLERFEAELSRTERLDGDPWCPEHLCTRQGPEKRFVFLRNPSSEQIFIPTPEAERSKLAPWEMQIRVYGADGRLESVSPPPVSWVAPAAPTPPSLPRLERWQFSGVSPQLDPAYDDSGWSEIPAEAIERGGIDIDSLGLHYGHVWYRGTFHGPLDRLLIDARHCWSVWINRRLVAAGDAFQNRLGVGPDGARQQRIPLRKADWNEGRNVVVVLVESLGHPKNFADDGGQPRGIVQLDVGTTPIQWRFRGGIVRGEQGMNPLVAFDSVERVADSEEVVLPHGWTRQPDGVALYETRFSLDGIDPKEQALGLSFDPGHGKAQLYLNGYLIGRYWSRIGPQSRFLLPWGMLQHEQENELAVTVWKRSSRAALGKLRLQIL